MAGYASPFTPISIEITQSGLPGSGVHYVMTGWFQTPGFKSRSQSRKSDNSYWRAAGVS